MIRSRLQAVFLIATQELPLIRWDVLVQDVHAGTGSKMNSLACRSNASRAKCTASRIAPDLDGKPDATYINSV